MTEAEWQGFNGGDFATVDRYCDGRVSHSQVRLISTDLSSQSTFQSEIPTRSSRQ